MKTIKRYPNRKLYDTSTSKYITLEEIANLLKTNEELRVIDSKTGEDITSITLAQVLAEQEKRRAKDIPIKKIFDLFQTTSSFLKERLTTPFSLRDEAEKTVQRLWHTEQAGEIKEFLLSTHKAYEEVVHLVDEKVAMVLSVLRNLSPVLKEIDKLKHEVQELRTRLEEMERKLNP